MQKSRRLFLLFIFFTLTLKPYAIGANSYAQHINTEIISIKNLILRGDQVYKRTPDSAFTIWTLAEDRALNAFKFVPESDKKNYTELCNIYGEICFSLGSYHYYRSKIQTASAYYQKARTYYSKNNNFNGEGLCLNNMGLIYQFYLSENDSALSNYRQAYSFFIKSGNDVEQATALHNIASIYEKKGEINKALAFYNQSLAIRRKKGSPQIGQTLFNLSSIYKKLNQHQKTKQYLLECLKIFQDSNSDMRMLSYTCASLGNFYLENNQTDSALYYGKKSFDISKKLNYPSNIKESAITLNKIYIRNGDFNKATFYLKKFIDAKDSLNNEDLKNEYIRQQIKYDYDKKQYDDSVSYLIQEELRAKQIRHQDYKIEQEKNFRNTAFLLSLLFITSGWGLYRRSVHKIKDRQNQLMIESLETEQQLLRAQMNPHYIFNSLSVIQGMLLSSNLALAKKYLQRFSALIRSVMDLSSKKYVSLKDELDSVKIYLELEKMRFREKLNFSIQIDDQLVFNTVKIPPMLIQPFVENAILHGIKHRENGGEVNISIKKMNHLVHCTITDNGIGRQASEKINQTGKKEKKSLAIELSMKRLHLNKEKFAEQGNIQITDLFNSDGQPSGTKVELFIPFR
jgi:tetratricopeptide (TPR) repeat protein